MKAVEWPSKQTYLMTEELGNMLDKMAKASHTNRPTIVANAIRYFFEHEYADVNALRVITPKRRAGRGK